MHVPLNQDHELTMYSKINKQNFFSGGWYQGFHPKTKFFSGGWCQGFHPILKLIFCCFVFLRKIKTTHTFVEEEDQPVVHTTKALSELSKKKVVQGFCEKICQMIFH